jgi:PAS domain S-box-containing protein
MRLRPIAKGGAGGGVAAAGRGARRITEPKVDRIFDLAVDMVGVVGFDGCFKAVNPSYERTLGYSRDEIVGRPCMEVIHPDDRERTRAAFETVVKEGQIGGFENRCIHSDGSVRWLQWSGRGIPDEELIYCVARDVTDRRRAEVKALEAEQAAQASRDELRGLAAEQTTLRRVATLVAKGVPSSELFDAVTEEVGRLFRADLAGMIRYLTDDSITPVATWAADGEHPPVEGVWPLEGDQLASGILATRAPVREDDWNHASGPIAEFIREQLGVRSSVGSPIIVEGRVWGGLFVHSKGAPLPPDTESRFADFTELVATAISNTEARAEVGRLADEQAALRRVATEIARDPSPEATFAVVAEEAGRVLRADIGVARYEADGTITVLGRWGDLGPALVVGARVPLGGRNLTSLIFQTKRPARIDAYTEATGEIADVARSAGVRSGVGSPIVVGGQLWGVMVATSRQPEALPENTEARVGEFTELIGTAISNTEARAEVRRLADEQAALQRVATLVARGVAPDALFAAVTEEVGRLFGVDAAIMFRLDHDWTASFVAGTGWKNTDLFRVGRRWAPENMPDAARENFLAGRALRIDDYTGGELAKAVRDEGIASTVAAPIAVEGRLWGFLAVASQRGSLPSGTEERIMKFTELVATAIANAHSRAELRASRARLVAAGDEARRRVVRDLHDGAQQRLVHTIVSLKLAEWAFREGDGKAESLIGEALEQAQRSHEELRELAHGILPAVLTDEGLRAGVDAVVARLDLPVEVEVPAERYPAEIEASAYFIVSEALTNVVKHSQAGSAEVKASVQDGILRLEVRDDGIGGADPNGHGLVGIADRVTALGGRLEIDSVAGEGTLLAAALPLHAG